MCNSYINYFPDKNARNIIRITADGRNSKKTDRNWKKKKRLLWYDHQGIINLPKFSNLGL